MTMLRPRLWTPPHDAAAAKRLPALTAQLQTRLQQIVRQHQHIKFASSLAVEDMVITDVIVRAQLPIEVFTLNTGALNNETQKLLRAAYEHWGIRITEYRPDEEAVDAYVAAHGKQAFYDSVALRRECCHIRKIEPLGRALSKADAWITGQRREQSTTRTALALAEQDKAHGIAKYNPLADWLETEVWAYARMQQLPVNELYQQGYPSIGCEPCTRPVKAGEDIRAGRWWWESQDSKECGLHK
ncbi:MULTISPECIES: phosphoadenylyl-sulfate reductase [Snodgrassella]|nr:MULTISPECIES: phosphoadenylyl-sulfate reductase [Snodgrassella]